MKLLKIYFNHVRMFEDGIFNLDLYARDKVPATDESVAKICDSLYTNNMIALAGINASGKSTALKLLRFAVGIINGEPVGRSTFAKTLPSIFEGETEFRCLVWQGGTVRCLVSKIIFNELGEQQSCLKFVEEKAYSISSSKFKRSTLASWENIFSKSIKVTERSDVEPFAASILLDDMSALPALLHFGAEDKIRIIQTDEVEALPSTTFAGMDETLKVFDPSIETLEIKDSGRAFVLKFIDQRQMTLSYEGLHEVLSSGTEQGLKLVRCAVEILEGGGYLLIDEMENHLNRQLVNVLLDLFDSRKTNPHGATIVFTTHYPQLLDYVHRKDNVYFLARTNSNVTEIVKYGDVVKRIENKKSEVFSSNFVKGTAPRYADVAKLKGIVEDAVVTNA